MDYYGILGVSKNSNYEEIKTRYRELVKKYHPDVNNGSKEAEEHFKKIVEAYEFLSNEKKNGNEPKIKYETKTRYENKYEPKWDYRYEAKKSYERYNRDNYNTEKLYTTATEKQVKFAKYLLFNYGKRTYTPKQLDYLWKILKMYEVPLYAVKRVIDDLSDFVD